MGTRRFQRGRSSLVLVLAGLLLGCTSEGTYALVGEPYCHATGRMTVDRLPRPARLIRWTAKPWRFSMDSQHGELGRSRPTELGFAPGYIVVYDCGPNLTRFRVGGMPGDECVELYSGTLGPKANAHSESLGYDGIVEFPKVDFECARGDLQHRTVDDLEAPVLRPPIVDESSGVPNKRGAPGYLEGDNARGQSSSS